MHFNSSHNIWFVNNYGFTIAHLIPQLSMGYRVRNFTILTSRHHKYMDIRGIFLVFFSRSLSLSRTRCCLYFCFFVCFIHWLKQNIKRNVNSLCYKMFHLWYYICIYVCGCSMRRHSVSCSFYVINISVDTIPKHTNNIVHWWSFVYFARRIYCSDQKWINSWQKLFHKNGDEIKIGRWYFLICFVRRFGNSNASKLLLITE